MRNSLKIIFLFIFSLIINKASFSQTNNTVNNFSNTVNLGQFEVSEKDLGTLNWIDAMNACIALGKGWRLPDRDELNTIYMNKEKLGIFANDYYWTADQGYSFDVAWCLNFEDGKKRSFPKINKNIARAVRSI